MGDSKYPDGLISELRQHADNFNNDGASDNPKAHPDLYRDAANRMEQQDLLLRELLEACREAIVYIMGDVEDESFEERVGYATETHRKLKAAIAKATGQEASGE